jgi:hypothetical protein
MDVLGLLSNNNQWRLVKNGQDISVIEIIFSGSKWYSLMHYKWLYHSLG